MAQGGRELPTVRMALPVDEDAVMAMCERLHRENGMFSLSENKVRGLLHRAFKGDKVIVGVIGHIGTIEASTCLVLSEPYYSEEWELCELWNFVDEPFRKSRNAMALIEYGKGAAEKIGLPLVTGVITNKKMAGKVRLYRQLLGPPAGAFFVHNSPWKSEPIEDNSDLARRLKEFAKLCHTTPRDIKFSVVKDAIAPLLREAAEVVESEGKLWGPGKSNGAVVTNT